MVDILFLYVNLSLSLLPPFIHTQMVKRPLEAETPRFHPNKLDPSHHHLCVHMVDKGASCTHHAAYCIRDISYKLY